MRFFIFLIMISGVAYGNCLDSLYDGKSSSTHKIELDNSFEYSQMSRYSKKAVERLLVSFSCDVSSLANPTCREINRGTRESLVCYTQSSQGYFLIQKDYSDNLNILVNRWD